MSTPTAPVALADERTGSGSPLVLIHGITEDRTAFGTLTGKLGEHFDVLAVDLRGHGGSSNVGPYDLETMAADVAQSVQRAWPDGPAPLVVGHSLGGAVATAYAAKYPTAGVVNIDQSMDLGAFQEMVRGAEPMLRSDACGQVMIGLFEGMYGALDTRRGRPAASAARRPAGVGARRLGRAVRPRPARVGGARRPGDQPPRPVALPGDPRQDPGPDYPAWLQQRVPGATVELWADLGHYPHLVRPDEFVGTVVASPRPSAEPRGGSSAMPRGTAQHHCPRQRTARHRATHSIFHPNGPTVVRYADNEPTPVINPQRHSIRFPRPSARLDEGR